jgi:putative nucleotidyltransferase with HDIG domain
MIATFATVVVILAGVLSVLTVVVRERVRASVSERLEKGQQMLSALEARRTADLQVEAATLAESPTIKAALDTFYAERAAAGGHRRELLATVQREISKLATRIQPDVLAVADTSGEVVGIAGRQHDGWTPPRARQDGIAASGGRVFRFASAPLEIADTQIGTLYLASALDSQYASELSALSGTRTVIALHGTAIASTLPDAADRALDTHGVARLNDGPAIGLAGEQYAVRRLLQDGDAAVYTLDSIDAAAGPVLSAAFRAVLLTGIGALLLAGLASISLSHSVARPIDLLSRSLTGMIAARAFDTPVPMTGSSREVDALAGTFNSLMTSLAAAESETRDAYVGAIRALAMALDARDPYTAGHSERVSAIAVAIGQQLGLAEPDIDVLRLGALLHDIGKIGIPDDVLRKPGPLTAAEFETIKQHPGMGARILRNVPFLAPHLPIVELHHERPDGKGYPYGLRADETPLLARIVHVADAFDAITSARAYRPARSAAEGLAELWKHAGSQFDAEAVQALAATAPTLQTGGGRIETTAARAARRSALTAVARS